MVHVVVVILSTITVWFYRGVFHVVVVGYGVYHCCLKIYRGVVHVVVVICISLMSTV